MIFHAGGSGEQNADADGERQQTDRADVQSGDFQVHGPPQGGQAPEAAETGQPRDPPRQADGEAAYRAESGRVQY